MSVLEIAGRERMIFQEGPNNRRGFGGITPEKILTFYIAKDAISCITNSLNSAILNTQKFLIDCLTRVPASQAEEISDSQLS